MAPAKTWGQHPTSRSEQHLWLSLFRLLMHLTLTAKVWAVPLCFLSLISPEASSKQTAWLDWVMCLCFLVWWKHALLELPPLVSLDISLGRIFKWSFTWEYPVNWLLMLSSPYFGACNYDNLLLQVFCCSTNCYWSRGRDDIYFHWQLRPDFDFEWLWRIEGWTWHYITGSVPRPSLWMPYIFKVMNVPLFVYFVGWKEC